MAGEAIRVIIVDDSYVVRSGLRASLAALEDIEVVGEAGTGREGIELAQRENPDVILMDIRMPDLDGIAATKQLTEANPKTKVLMLSATPRLRLITAPKSAFNSPEMVIP